MLASYERVRIGMTSSEVRAEVAQPLADDKAWHDTLFFEHWKVMKAEEAPAEGQENKSWDNHDDWLDRDLIIMVFYRDGKAVSKQLVKATPDWRAMAKYWFAGLRLRFFP
jgi:hypothetical protein